MDYTSPDPEQEGLTKRPKSEESFDFLSALSGGL
jgi:hypothetical protein